MTDRRTDGQTDRQMSIARRDLTKLDAHENAFVAADHSYKRILVYLEPRERVWWLQMLLSTAGEANGAPSNSLARKGKGGKRKGRKGIKGREKHPLPEIKFWLRP